MLFYHHGIYFPGGIKRFVMYKKTLRFTPLHNTPLNPAEGKRMKI
jgi:hypothetical protein